MEQFVWDGEEEKKLFPQSEEAPDEAHTHTRDKKQSKVVCSLGSIMGIRTKDGRILTPEEAFELFRQKFIGGGRINIDKRMEELKIYDSPSNINVNAKPGQSSDPRSMLAALEKELDGGWNCVIFNKRAQDLKKTRQNLETNTPT